MKSLTRVADRTLGIACNATLLILLIVVMSGVVSRAVNRPVVWSDDLSRFLMVWLSFPGWTLATRNHAHIRVGLVLDLLPPRLQRVFEAAIQAITGSIGLAFVWYGLTLTGPPRVVTSFRKWRPPVGQSAEQGISPAYRLLCHTGTRRGRHPYPFDPCRRPFDAARHRPPTTCFPL